MSIKVVEKSKKIETPSPVDRLSSLLERFRVRASLFHNGPLCGMQTFEAKPGRAFLHVLRHGRTEIRHARRDVPQQVLCLDEPTLLLYPRPIRHVFVNPPQEGSDFTCAALDFDGGDRNPFVNALPSLVQVPLAEVDGLRPSLDLLFAETDRMRCGSRLLTDRLLEVVLIQLLRWIIDHPQRIGVTRGLITGLADPRLARALVALHRAPDEEWPLVEMARVAGMSRSAFAQAFRLATGTTPGCYVADWRLTLAATMIRSGRPVKSIADELGFASASSLSRAFRQRLGVSPRAWARREAAGAD